MLCYLTAENLLLMKTNNIAVVCDDLTEFFVYRSAIDKLLEKKLDVDIIVPYDSGYNGLAEHTLKAIKKLGYAPKNDAPKNKQYKILITPYPGLDVVRRLNYIYHMQLSYGPISTKPYPTYLPSTLLDYDVIFCFNNYDKDFYGAYGAKIFTIPYWRYYNFKKQPQNHSKPALLILPTFGADTSLINLINDKLIQQLKDNYYIITKAHHAIHFGIDGQDALQKVQDIADEFYNSDTPIDELLQKADLVLSDNSGSIFESICAEVPVVLFSYNPNSRHLKTINTIQSKLIDQGILPHTDNPNQVLNLLNNTKTFFQKQQKLRAELFLPFGKNPYKQFIETIDHYLTLDETQDYRKILHDIMVKEWYDNQQTIKHQSKIINQKQQEIDAILNSTSWKITKPIRKLKDTGRKNVQK